LATTALSLEAGLIGAAGAWCTGAALASKLMLRLEPKPVPLKPYSRHAEDMMCDVRCCMCCEEVCKVVPCVSYTVW